MIVAVASGKGGTGKTFVATNLAVVRANVDFIDCDVEAANAHLFLHPEIEEIQQANATAPEPILDRCTVCGECVRRCRFNALALVAGKVLVFPELCHDCGVCFSVCPADALGEKQHRLGTVRRGRYAFGAFADGELEIGEVRSAAVIARVKEFLRPSRDTILDCPPGASCSMVESLDGADLCLVVTEPTPLGLHDLEVTADLLDYLGIPCGVVINRCDLGSAPVEQFCRERDVPILARIPFDRRISTCYSRGELVIGRAEVYDRVFEELACAVFESEWEKKPSQPVLSLGRKAEPNSLQPQTVPGDASKQLVVISGKGGTGKTSFCSVLARVANDDVIADCDVEASNLNLLLHPQVKRTFPFEDTFLAEIAPDLCDGCGVCADRCTFRAIKIDGGVAVVDPIRCEGCGFCEIVCPLAGSDAMPVTIRQRVSGEAFDCNWGKGPFVSAQINPGGENSGKLVTMLRGIAQERAENGRSILIDGPPGIGCPVNASLVATHLAVIVTEPTPSGLHDMARAIELARFLGVEPVVIINKADLNIEEARRTEQFCRERGVPTLGRIPFDRSVASALSEGKSLLGTGSEAGRAMAALAGDVLERLGGNRKE